MNRWKAAVAIAVVAFVGVPAGWAVLEQSKTPNDGPLDGGAGRVDGQPLDVNDSYTMGSVLLRNEADEPVVIEDVELLGIHGPLRVHAVLSRAWPPESGPALSAGEEDYPPTRSVAQPLHKLNVVPVAQTRTEEGTPGEGIQLFFGVEITDEGVAGAEQVEVTYKVGKRRYKEKFDRAFFLCAPRQAYRTGTVVCPPAEISEALPF